MGNIISGTKRTFQSMALRVDRGLLVLLTLPWLLLLINQSWIFNPVGWIDPWLYFGYFHSLGQYLKVFAGAYYGTRLPLILPGYLSYKIFPPLVANYVLHLGFYYIAILSLYFTLKQVASGRSALITSVLMGGYPFFLRAVGWDYVDGAAIAYFLLTTLFLTLAAKSSRWQTWRFSIQRGEESGMTVPVMTAAMLFMAGASGAALVFTNTFFIILGPIILLYYLMVNHSSRRNSLASSVLFLALGFVSFTLLLGGVSEIAGGNLLFFLPSFSYGLNLLGYNPWKAPDYAWLANATWLVIPFFVFCTSAVSLFRSLRRHLKETPESKPSLCTPEFIINLCYILIVLIMVTLELAGFPDLQVFYYASYLIPGMALAAGIQMSSLLNKLSKGQFIWLTSGLIILLTLPLQPAIHSIIATHINLTSVIYPLAFVILGVVIILLLGTRIAWIGMRPAVILLFVLTNFTMVGSCSAVDFTDSQRGEGLLAVHQSIAAYRPFNLSGDLRFWYSADEPLGGLYRSVASSDLWGYRLVNESFPTLADVKTGPNTWTKVDIPVDTKIAILSNQENVLEKANPSLEEIGLHARLIGQERIQQGKIVFVMTFIQVEHR